MYHESSTKSRQDLAKQVHLSISYCTREEFVSTSLNYSITTDHHLVTIINTIIITISFIGSFFDKHISYGKCKRHSSTNSGIVKILIPAKEVSIRTWFFLYLLSRDKILLRKSIKKNLKTRFNFSHAHSAKCEVYFTSQRKQMCIIIIWLS